jgi:hypothetical protein
VVPVIELVNCFDWPAVSDAVMRARPMPTGVGAGVEDGAGAKVIAAFSDLVVSAALVATTVSVCCVLTVAGAV